MLLAGQSDEVARDPYRVATLCTPLVAGSRQPVTVSNGEELQQALDRAVGGDTIVLAAGATFPARRRAEGSFMLRNRHIPAGRVGDDSLRACRPSTPSGAVPPSKRVDQIEPEPDAEDSRDRGEPRA